MAAAKHTTGAKKLTAVTEPAYHVGREGDSEVFNSPSSRRGVEPYKVLIHRPSGLVTCNCPDAKREKNDNRPLLHEPEKMCKHGRSAAEEYEKLVVEGNDAPQPIYFPETHVIRVTVEIELRIDAPDSREAELEAMRAGQDAAAAFLHGVDKKAGVVQVYKGPTIQVLNRTKHRD